MRALFDYLKSLTIGQGRYVGQRLRLFSVAASVSAGGVRSA